MNLIKLSFSTLALSSLLFASNYKIDSNTSKAEFSKIFKTQDVKVSLIRLLENLTRWKNPFNFTERWNK